MAAFNHSQKECLDEISSGVQHDIQLLQYRDDLVFSTPDSHTISDHHLRSCYTHVLCTRLCRYPDCLMSHNPLVIVYSEMANGLDRQVCPRSLGVRQDDYNSSP